jgi:membrane-associated progesterone receptor component
VLLAIGWYYTDIARIKMPSSSSSEKSSAAAAEEKEEPDPPRNFTQEQLAYFDGTIDETVTKKNENEPDTMKPVYLSLKGIVFDCSEGRHFYGPQGPYEAFAGHECGVALAKMSFDTTYLDNLDGCLTLNFSEKVDLDGWMDKFTYYRCYPIKGRLVPDKYRPSPDRIWTIEELSQYTGAPPTSSSSSKSKPNEDSAVKATKDPLTTNNTEQKEAETNPSSSSVGDTIVPEGYATPPIYIGLGEYVYDVSFGGVGFYGPGGPYHRFAGTIATRSLAKMSFDAEHMNNRDTSDLTDKEKKILDDWITTFAKKKKYPVVGKLAL